MAPQSGPESPKNGHERAKSAARAVKGPQGHPGSTQRATMSTSRGLQGRPKSVRRRCWRIFGAILIPKIGVSSLVLHWFREEHVFEAETASNRMLDRNCNDLERFWQPKSVLRAAESASRAATSRPKSRQEHPEAAIRARQEQPRPPARPPWGTNTTSLSTP